MFFTIRLTAAASCLLLLLCSNSFAGIVFNVDIEKGSSPLATTVLVEQLGDDLRFTMEVDRGSSSIGDLRGLFFDVSDDSSLFLSGLSVLGLDVTDFQFATNRVSNLGHGVNVNGAIVSEGKFDAGIEFGTSGIGKDDIQSTSFVLTHSSGLDLNSFFGTSAGSDDYIMAVRATSVGPENGARGGSSKSGATSFEPPLNSSVNPEPTSAIVWFGILTVGALRRTRFTKN